jgi:thiamine-monophosphate kinase
MVAPMSRSARATTIGDVGEFDFLSRLLPRLPGGSGVLVGPGQDCAVVRCGGGRYLFTIDALVEGVHFERSWLTPRQLGRKSLLVNVSDVAAMGGRPRFCVVGVAVPTEYPVRDLSALQAGIVEAASDMGAAVVGGNLTRAPQLSVCIALLAEAPQRIVTRRGASQGDRIYVTGTLGDAALGCRVLRGGCSGGMVQATRRFREPSPRLLAGRLLVDSGIASAMIDVSDGLVQDLGHICEQSRVGAVVHTDRVPLSTAYRAALGCHDLLALHGGEDYELLCTVPERQVKRLERVRARLGCAITWIGQVAAGRRLRLLGPDGHAVHLTAGGFDHFQSRPGRRNES